MRASIAFPDVRRTFNDSIAELNTDDQSWLRSLWHREMLRWILVGCIFVFSFPALCIGQYKGDHIPGFVGLESGSQAPPGFYVGNVVWVYPTSTIKDSSGNNVPFPGV
jgi:hypothetical protein